MKSLRYFLEFLAILILFFIFKIIGIKFSSYIGEKIGLLFGPLFRSKKLIESNILKAYPNIKSFEIKTIVKQMWSNYGKILAEYMFIKNFRENFFKKKIKINGQEVLEAIQKNKEPVIFVSGHFNNFELLAMCIDKFNIPLTTIYRPLNNMFTNIIMESIRKKYICKNQIKKGKSGIKESLLFFKKGFSIALMIDQRVSEGIKSNFFGKEAHTTTVPAQFVKKFNCKIVPMHIERKEKNNFEINIYEPIQYSKEKTIEDITKDLNLWLEKMILKNPSQWICTHNRWK
jgi:KDO2-lipid IV(A) lauroyltransferase